MSVSDDADAASMRSLLSNWMQTGASGSGASGSGASRGSSGDGSRAGGNSAATNEATIDLQYDENEIEQVLRGFDEPISLLCTMRRREQTTEKDIEFRVNATLVPMGSNNKSASTASPPAKDRTFYYLNGMLRCLVFLRMRYPHITKVTFQTDIKYLYCNARAKRVAQWKKRGFKTKTGAPITHRALWEELWTLMRFIDVETVEKKK